MSADERRARLARRHRLGADRAHDPVDAAGGVVALHATDPATVFLSLAARAAQPSIAAVEDALYDRRSLVRMLGMRRTMFVVPVGTADVVHGAASLEVARRERKRLVEVIEQSGVAGDGAAWLAAVESATVEALDSVGEATANELARVVPELAVKLRVGEGTRWAATQGASTRVLLVLAACGKVVRGRPRGSWTASLYRWARTERWLGRPLEERPEAEARAALVRAYLAANGPARLADLRWWTGWPARGVARALAAVDHVAVDLGDGEGLLLAGDDEPVPAPEPWAALLPALDSTVMAWAEREWFLGPHRPALFDRSGNAGPTVWWSGRVVGGWGQRPGGEVVWRTLEDVGADGRRAIEDAAAALQAFVGTTRVTPRFRTPLERELSG